MIHFSPIIDPPQKFPVASFSEIRAIQGNSFGRAVTPLNTLKFSLNRMPTVLGLRVGNPKISKPQN